MLQNGQIPILANVINASTASLTGTTVGILGTDTAGVIGYTAGAYGGRVYTALASSNYTTTAAIYAYILSTAGYTLPLGTISITLSSGNTAAARNIDLLDGTNIPGLPIDNTGKRYIPLQPNDKLKFAPVTSLINTTNKIFVSCFGADYQSIV